MRLTLKEITDTYVRSNFSALADYFRRNRQLEGFRLIEIEFSDAVTNQKYPHGLGFKPKDVVQTSKTGAGSITWNYDEFDSTNLDITTTGACVVRAYVGTHQEGAE